MSKEEVGLHFTFEETRLRGSKKFQCILRASEISTAGVYVEEIIVSNSWNEFKKNYPTLKDILIQLFPSDSWNPSWRCGERILFVKEISGHEGLYDFDKNVRVEVDWDTEIK